MGWGSSDTVFWLLAEVAKGLGYVLWGFTALGAFVALHWSIEVGRKELAPARLTGRGNIGPRGATAHLGMGRRRPLRDHNGPVANLPFSTDPPAELGMVDQAERVAEVVPVTRLDLVLSGNW